MNHFFINSLLQAVAKLSYEKEVNFNRKEIQKKIDEIKYLSTTDFPPHLIEKHIRALEDRLNGIYKLEEELDKKRKEENIKIGALKRQVEHLKKRIHLEENKNLQKRVDKLSHILAECLAQHETKKEISKFKENDSKRSELLWHRFLAIKQEVDILKHTLRGDKLENVLKIEQLLKLLEPKMMRFQSVVITEKPKEKVKHKVMFNPDIKALERELPLAPPPRITKN